MNSNIINYLEKYIKDSDPRYAVALTGKWGCGKSFLVDTWVNDLKSREKKSASDQNSLELKPIYVSLYGMKSVGEVVKAIKRQLHPFLYSKSMEMLKGFAKIAGKATINANFDLDGNVDTSELSISTSLDSLDEFNPKEETIKGDKLLIFDDFERCQIDTKELMGFINGFVERNASHVIIVGDFEKLSINSKEAYDEYREKTIGKIFEVHPDPERALEVFLDEVPRNEWTISQKELIVECFYRLDNHNLRLLRQAVRDFNSVIENHEVNDKNSHFMKALLASFIIAVNMNGNPEDAELLRRYRQRYINSLANDDKYKEKISSLQSRFNPISERIGYNILDVYNLAAVCGYIECGKPMDEYIHNKNSDFYRTPNIYESLRNYQLMEDAEFDKLYDVLEARVLDDKDSISADELALALGWLLKFDHLSIRHLNEDIIDLIKNRFQKLIEQQESSEDVYSTYMSFSRNLLSFPERTEKRRDILHDVEKIRDDRLRMVPDEMQLLLRSLNDSNVEKLSELDLATAPDLLSNFSLRPIFHAENPDVIFESIKRLSNKGITVFTDFIRQHYMLEFTIEQTTAEKYLPDLCFLEKLSDLVTHALCSMQGGISRYNYDDLHLTLVGAIQRLKSVKAKVSL